MFGLPTVLIDEPVMNRDVEMVVPAPLMFDPVERDPERIPDGTIAAKSTQGITTKMLEEELKKELATNTSKSRYESRRCSETNNPLGLTEREKEKEYENIRGPSKEAVHVPHNSSMPTPQIRPPPHLHAHPLLPPVDNYLLQLEIHSLLPPIDNSPPPPLFSTIEQPPPPLPSIHQSQTPPSHLYEPPSHLHPQLFTLRHPPASPYTSPPITLLVGGPLSPEPTIPPQIFYVHADLLTSVSPFFRAAFDARTRRCGLNGDSEGFLESRTLTMRLPEERVEDVRFLLQWVYWKAAKGVVGDGEMQGGDEDGRMDWDRERMGSPVSASARTYQTKITSKRTLSDAVRGHVTVATTTTTNHSRKPYQNSSTYGSPPSPPSIISHLGLYHPEIDPQLLAHAAYRREKELLAPAARLGDISGLLCGEPDTASFTPLVRLYCLVERLDIRDGLKGDICRRVREVGKGCGIVPGRGDVRWLWEGVPELTRRGMGRKGKKTEVRKDGEDLKEVFLEMYARMEGWGRFEIGMEDEDEEKEWHPAFLRELVVRLLREKRGAKTDGTGVWGYGEADTCIGMDGESGGAVDEEFMYRNSECERQKGGDVGSMGVDVRDRALGFTDRRYSELPLLNRPGP